MALVTCPDCQKQHSDAAPACPTCGRPHLAAPVVAAVPLPQGRYAQAPVGPRLACPACGSPDVKKLSLVYREGTAQIQLNTGGVVAGRGGAAAIGAHSVGGQRSLLAAGAQPPAKKTVKSGWLGLLGVPVAIVGVSNESAVAVLIGLALLAVTIVEAVNASKWNREQYPQLYSQWDATFLCTRCEKRFIPR